MELAEFGELLREHADPGILYADTVKASYIIDKVKKAGTWKEDWSGGPIPVPFKTANASTYTFGGLTPVADINRNQFIKGYVNDKKTITGSMKWLDKDIRDHTFDSMLGNVVMDMEEFVEGMKEKVSLNFLNGPYTTRIQSRSSDPQGIVKVSDPERLQLDEKVFIEKSDGSVIQCYVHNFDLNTNEVVFFDKPSRSVTAQASYGSQADAANRARPIDFSQNPVNAGAKVFMSEGYRDELPFTSLREQILSAKNGGSADLFGKVKTDYPVLQSLNFDGSEATGLTILDMIHSSIVKSEKIGRTRGVKEAMVPHSVYAPIMKYLESGSGPYRHIGTKANPFGYKEITISGVKQDITLVVVPELDHDIIMGIDWSGVMVKSNKGGFRQFKDKNGNNFYTIRDDKHTKDYLHIQDYYFEGELMLLKPSACWAIHGLDPEKLNNFDNRMVLTERISNDLSLTNQILASRGSGDGGNLLAELKEAVARLEAIQSNTFVERISNESQETISGLDAAMNAVAEEIEQGK